jgi:cephalosporin-C deacetylase
VHSTTQGGMIIRGLSDPDPDRLLMRDVFLDTAQLARLVMAFPNVDASRVGAFGGSQGGGLTLACASLEPGIKRLCPTYPFLTDYKRVWDMDLTPGAYVEIRTYFRLFDPNHKRENEIFTKLGYIDVQHLTNRIKGETLMLTGLMDTVCPPSTQFAAYNKITAPKRLEIWPDFGHETLPGSADITYQWMLGL